MWARTPSSAPPLLLLPEDPAKNPADAFRRSGDGLSHRVRHIGHKDRMPRAPLDQKWQLPLRLPQRSDLRQPAHKPAAVVQLSEHLEVQSVVRAHGAVAGDGPDLRKNKVEV